MTTERVLVDLLVELRPEWDVAGCVAALRAMPDLPLPTLVYGLLRYATDPANLTPKHLADLGNRAWDSTDPWPCRIHPLTKARRIDGTCASCWADAHVDDHPQLRDRGGRPIPDEARRLVVAALQRSPAEQATPDVATDPVEAL